MDIQAFLLANYLHILSDHSFFYFSFIAKFFRMNKFVSISIVLLASHLMNSLYFSLLTLIFLLTFFSLLSLDNNYVVKAQQQLQSQTRMGAPLAIVPGLTGNVLTAVSFLIGTSSFILGLRIQSASKTAAVVDQGSPMSRLTPSSSTITKYYELLIIALVAPSIVINIYGILLVSSHLYLEDAPYLLLLFVLFIPIGAILFLVKKLH